MFLLPFLASRVEVAQACAVCFAGEEATRGAFIGTTVFMSLFPLVIIFGGIWVLYKRSMVAEEPVDEA
jgi:hypothetical protein